MEQRIAVAVSAAFALLLLGVFARVARSAGQSGTVDEIAEHAAKWRRGAFWGLLALFVPTIGYSLTLMPYAARGAPGAAPAVVVQATGHQWAWELTPSTVPAGQPVEIRVTGADVNHGLGVYDPTGRLITQTQAMPGYTNVIRHTFATPGTYHVLCLEYCGLGHHTMSAPLVVTAAASATR